MFNNDFSEYAGFGDVGSNFFRVMNLIENLINAMGLLSLKIHIQIFR